MSSYPSPKSNNRSSNGVIATVSSISSIHQSNPSPSSSSSSFPPSSDILDPTNLPLLVDPPLSLSSFYPTSPSLQALSPLFPSPLPPSSTSSSALNLLAQSHHNKTTPREQAILRLLQHALETFTRRASQHGDLHKIMDELCLIVGRALQSKHVKVLELLQGGEALLLRAGIGWKDGLVGNALVGTSTQSQSGYALATNRPVIVENFHSETRFNWPSLHQGHGVFSGVSVVIGSSCQPRPYGVLGLHSNKRRMFTQGEVNFLQGMASVLADSIDRFNIPALLTSSIQFTNSFLVEGIDETIDSEQLHQEAKIMEVHEAFDNLDDFVNL